MEWIESLKNLLNCSASRGSGGSNAGDAPDELPTEEPSGKEEEDTTDEEKALQSFLQSNEVVKLTREILFFGEGKTYKANYHKGIQLRLKIDDGVALLKPILKTDVMAVLKELHAINEQDLKECTPIALWWYMPSRERKQEWKVELSSGKEVSLRASKVAAKTFPNRTKLYLPEPAANKAEAASDDPADAEALPESADPERDEAVEQIAALAAVGLRLQAAWIRLDELASVGDPGPDAHRDQADWTGLGLACRKGDTVLAEQFLDWGAKWDHEAKRPMLAKEIKDRSIHDMGAIFPAARLMRLPLLVAAVHGHVDVVNMMITKKNRKTQEHLGISLPLNFVSNLVYNNDLRGTKLLVAGGILVHDDINELGESPLHCAAKYNRLEHAKFMYANIRCHPFCEAKHLKKLRIKEHDNAARDQKRTLLEHERSLCLNEHRRNFICGIHTKPGVKKAKLTPLHLAAIAGHAQFCFFLARRGANAEMTVRHTDWRGVSKLMTPKQMAPDTGLLPLPGQMTVSEAIDKGKKLYAKNQAPEQRSISIDRLSYYEHFPAYVAKQKAEDALHSDSAGEKDVDGELEAIAIEWEDLPDDEDDEEEEKEDE